MMWFKDRNKLAKHFEKWAKENGASICPLNVITWLISVGLLDTDKAFEYLRENEAIL